MATLYRDYRPQNFTEVVGQNHVKITLEHQIESGKIAHAYLFCGSRGIGKTTIARVFAKSINCLNRKNSEYEPCNKCDMCLDITAGRSMDVIEIDAASNTGIENVRENVIATARVAPARAKNKVFIIDEVHMLSIPAFNALLKILEEPPKNVFFILCTTEVHKIPETIISRCQRFDFKRISIVDVKKKLQYITDQEKIKIDSDILESIARYSEGHMRDAESLLGQVVSISGKEVTAEEANLVIPRSDLNEALELMNLLSKKDASAAIFLLDKIIDEGIEIKNFSSNFIELLRKALLSKISPVLAEKIAIELGEAFEIKLNKVIANLEIHEIVSMIELFNKAKSEISKSFIAVLPLELAITEFCLGSVNKKTLNSVVNKVKVAPTAGVNVKKSSHKISTKEVGGQVGKQAQNVAAATVNKQLIEDKWHEVLAKVKRHNHSLSFILRACEPRDVNGKQVCLAFKYKFHQDRIKEANIKQIVEDVLKDVYGQSLFIEAIIDENIEPKNGINTHNASNEEPVNNIVETNEQKKSVENEKAKSNSDGDKGIIDNMLKTFGGKVVE